LAMEVLGGLGGVTAAVPDPQGAIGLEEQFRIADDGGVPGGGSSDKGSFRGPPPVDAVCGGGQANFASFLAVPAGVEHPPAAVGGPESGFAEAEFIEGAGVAEFEDGVGAKFGEGEAAIGGDGEAEALAAGAVLAEEVEVEFSVSGDEIGVGDAAFVPGATRAGGENETVLGPLETIRAGGEGNLRRFAGLIPV